MATFKRYEDIEAWQLARQLAKDIYALTRSGLFAKDFGLRDQIQRAAVSIGSNIAEGFERSGNKEFVYFLWIAKGSAGEVGSQLYTAFDIGYVSQQEFDSVFQQSKIIGAKIFRLIESMANSRLAGIRYRQLESVQGSRLNVQGSKFNVQGSKFNVQGSKFNVQGSKFNVQGSTRNLKPETLNPKP